jgi:hypothetical protein
MPIIVGCLKRSETHHPQSLVHFAIATLVCANTKSYTGVIVRLADFAMIAG